MDMIQSAIMTSSLINLPLAKRVSCVQFGSLACTQTAAVSVISRHFSSVLGIMGKFSATAMASPWGEQHRLVDCERSRSSERIYGGV